MAGASTQVQDKPLTGRTALVTGASGGIGAAIALAIAEAGADVALAYSSHRKDAEEVAERVGALGRRAELVHGDLADPQVPGVMVGQARQALGAVDILVANAGVGRQLNWDEVDADLWDTTMAVNARAPFLLAKNVLPSMVERGWGRVLLVSSIAALNGGIVGPHYAASKAALHGLTHHLAPRVAASGVTVNALAPALIGGTRILPTDAGEPGKLPAPIPVGRLGTTGEIATMALSMLTNGYLTNKVIAVDGGLYPY